MKPRSNIQLAPSPIGESNQGESHLALVLLLFFFLLFVLFSYHFISLFQFTLIIELQLHSLTSACPETPLLSYQLPQFRFGSTNTLTSYQRSPLKKNSSELKGGIVGAVNSRGLHVRNTATPNNEPPLFSISSQLRNSVWLCMTAMRSSMAAGA